MHSKDRRLRLFGAGGFGTHPNREGSVPGNQWRPPTSTLVPLELKPTTMKRGGPGLSGEVLYIMISMQ
jgi:hypothetical protein